MMNCKSCNKRLITRKACCKAVGSTCENCQITMDSGNYDIFVNGENNVAKFPISEMNHNHNSITNVDSQLIDENYELINNNVSDSNVSSCESLVKIGVAFERPNLESSFILPGDDTCSISVDSTPSIILDINDEIPIIYTGDYLVDERLRNEPDKLRQMESPVRSVENINMGDYKDALLASLYSQVEFLRKEVEEKNWLIRRFTEKEQVNYDRSNPKCLNNLGDRSRMDGDDVYENERDGVDVCENSHVTGDDEEFVIPFDELFSQWKSFQQEDAEMQLCEIRRLKHSEYLARNELINPTTTKSVDLNHESYTQYDINLPTTKNGTRLDLHNHNSVNDGSNAVHQWPENTILITGSSILCGLDEHRMNNKFNVKVRPHPGANIRDMYDHIAPHLRKRPAYIFLHIGSNDAPCKSSNLILDEMMTLKIHIESVLPTCKVFLSCPIIRFDDAKAGLTLRLLGKKMKTREDVIINDNIDEHCLGKRGLHLNPRGSGRLAINFLSLMKRL